MSIDAALRVHQGDLVVSKFSDPPLRPLRVTQAWVNATQTIVRFRIHALGGVWIDSEGVELPPKNMEWSRQFQRWQ